MGYKSITVTSRLGYLGEFEAEWWTEKDWKDYRKRVKQMKKDGTFGKKSTVTLMFKEIDSLSDGGNVNSGIEFKDMGFIIPENDIK